MQMNQIHKISKALLCACDKGKIDRDVAERIMRKRYNVETQFRRGIVLFSFGIMPDYT